MRILALLMRALDNQTIRFIFAGGVAACIYLAVIYVFLILGIPSWLSALLAYLVAFLIGYTAHKYFTFQSRSSHSTSLPRYAVLQIGSAAIAALSASGAERVGLTHPLMVSLLSTVFLGTVSFIASSKWVFSK